MSEYLVRIGDYAVAGEGSMMVTVGLGSCIAIALYDRRSRTGALAHCLLPDIGSARDKSNLARFPETAVPIMVHEMRVLTGKSSGALVAKLVGGASMFGSLISHPVMNVGARNIEAARSVLKLLGIPITAEDVGGEAGRSLRFSTSDGCVMVKTVHKGEHAI